MFLHMKVLADGWMPLRMARRRQRTPCKGASTSAMDERHIIQMKSVLEYTRSTFMHCNCYRSWNLSSKCLLYLHQELGELKSLCRVGSTLAQWWPKRHSSFSHCHPSAALQKWRQCILQSHLNGWQIMGAFIWPSTKMTECCKACLPKHCQGRTLQAH